MTGMAIVAMPRTTIRSPAPRRLPLMNPASFEALTPVATIAGIVPRPNAIMTSPPARGSTVVAAISNTLYTSPQGNQPHTSPRPSACGRVCTGTNPLAAGAMRCQIFAPAVSSGVRMRQPKASCRPTRMISRPLTRRTGAARSGIAPTAVLPISATAAPSIA